MLDINQVYFGECLELMEQIDDKSIDMILCDLPYNQTGCKWDIIIPFEWLWKQYKRIIKDKGAITLTASEPFSSLLVCSNLEMFKYTWCWNKIKPGNHTNAKYMPLIIHENVCIFSYGGISNGCKIALNYNPQMIERPNKLKVSLDQTTTNRNQKNPKYSSIQSGLYEKEYTHYYPKSIINFSNAQQKGKLHPTQKPVTLFEYLIKTYTNEGDLVLDNCCGSGTTAIAAINTKRNYILMDNGYNDLDFTYWDKELKGMSWADIAQLRIENHTIKSTLF